MYAPLKTNYADILNVVQGILKDQAKQKTSWKMLAGMPLVERVVMATQVFTRAHNHALDRIRHTGTAEDIAEAEAQVRDEKMVIVSAIQELVWASQKNPPVIFLESVEFCERLMDAKMEIASFECPLPEHFALMIPQGFKLDGHTIFSGVCSIIRRNDLLKQISNLPHDKNNKPVADQIANLAKAVSPSAGQIANLAKAASPSAGNLTFFIRLKAYNNTAPLFNAMLTLPEDKTHLDRLLQTPYKELNCADGMVKLVMSLIVYTQAAPERIKEGIHLKTSSLLATKSDQQIMITETKFKRDHFDHTSPIQPFFRRWHFKTLRHERYYHGVHKHKARGSRVIFVNAAMVGKTDNATVVED